MYVCIISIAHKVANYHSKSTYFTCTFNDTEITAHIKKGDIFSIPSFCRQRDRAVMAIYHFPLCLFVVFCCTIFLSPVVHRR